MTLQDVVEKFGARIDLEEHIFVSAETFFELFGVVDNLTYSELMSIDTEKGYGYGQYIQQWKEQGLIE